MQNEDIYNSIETIKHAINLCQGDIDKIKIGYELDMLNKKIDSFIIQETAIKPLIINIGIFAFSAVIFALVALIAGLLPDSFFYSGDKITSWLAFIFIIGCGITAATYAYRHNKWVGSFISIAWGSIFIDYFGYVTMNYGTLHPHLAAIGFNIAVIFQSLAILFCAFFGWVAFIRGRHDKP